MPAPTFVTDYASAFNSAADKTASVTTAVGDVLAILAAGENGGANIQLPTGGTGTYVNRETTQPTNGGRAEVRADTASAGITAQTYTLTQTSGGSVEWFGFDCLRFSGSDGIGASEFDIDNADAAPSLDIVTTQDNSALVVVVCDWNARDGTTRTWRTVNGTAPSVGNGFERVYFRDSAHYAVYIAYYPDAGAAGTKTVGLTTPSDMLASVAVVEIKGSAAAPAAPPVVEAVQENSVPTAGTSHAITLPAGITADEMTLILMDIGSTAATLNALTNWEELLDENLANGLKILRYIGPGIPGNPTFTSSASTRSASLAYRISGANKFIPPQIGTTATGSSTTPDPPPITPAGGVSKDYLSIAFYGAAGEEADDDTWSDTPPTGWSPTPPRQKACGTVGTNLGGMIAAAERQITTGAEINPGTFAKDVSAAWRAQHVLIHPGKPAGPGYSRLWRSRNHPAYRM
jgi:hypothetical protein